jgi:hypothetical protein
VAPDGTLSMVAGVGAYGFAGDGGPASEGSLTNPFDVAVDAVGNLSRARHEEEARRGAVAPGLPLMLSR